MRNKILKFFLESKLYENDEPLDFGSVGTDTVIADEPASVNRTPREVPKMHYRGQMIPKRSDNVIKLLNKNFSRMSQILKKDVISRIKNKKEMISLMRDFINTTLYNVRTSNVPPVVNKEDMRSPHDKKQFRSFLHYLTWVTYFDKFPKNSSREPYEFHRFQGVDLKDIEFVSQLFNRVWENYENEIRTAAVELKDDFIALNQRKKQRLEKDRQRKRQKS